MQFNQIILHSPSSFNFNNTVASFPAFSFNLFCNSLHIVTSPLSEINPSLANPSPSRLRAEFLNEVHQASVI